MQKELRNILTNTTSSPYNHPGAAKSVNIPGPPVTNMHNAVDDELGSDVTKDANNGIITCIGGMIAIFMMSDIIGPLRCIKDWDSHFAGHFCVMFEQSYLPKRMYG